MLSTGAPGAPVELLICLLHPEPFTVCITSFFQMPVTLSSEWINARAWGVKPTDSSLGVRRGVVINRSFWANGFVSILLAGTYR